ncbi:MAG: hypothetical protein ABR572_00135 [Cryomorphaceae bacterium]
MIIGKCKDDQEREFYIKMTKKYGWSTSVLNRSLGANLSAVK